MPTKDRERVLAVFVQMQDNPFQGEIQHLKNQPSAFRRRVGDWRILFDADPGRHLVIVTAIERRTTDSTFTAGAARRRSTAFA